MTPAAAVLFVFVAQGAARAPIDDVLAACLRALPAGTKSVTRTVAQAPPDAAVTAEARGAGAAAAVIASWSDAALSAVELRVLVGLPERSHWVARRVGFAPGDELTERERALGLIIASIVDEGLAREAPAPPPPRAELPPTPPVESLEPLGRWAMEAGVTMAVESGTDADDTIGGELGVRCFLRSNLAVRAGATFRFTQRDPPAPDLTGRVLGGGLGLGWTTAGFGRARRFGAGARADLLLVRQTVRLSAGDVIGERVYWSAGADALAEVGLAVSRGAMLLASAGLEEMFTEATVLVQGRDAATLHRARFLLQLGLLSRF